ncbi:hypothetical protein HDU84_009160 [Entophlyctis sp. JEL0112]|nr:hypothetical protein HDU84_009160 [Entophlyctis sp. JEL0112]
MTHIFLLEKVRQGGLPVFAFVSLVAIQTSTAVVYKFAGWNGHYGFSQASALALSEFMKLCISYGLLLSSRAGCDADAGSGEKDKVLLCCPHDDASFANHFVRVNQDLASFAAFPKFVFPIAGLAALYTFNNHLGFEIFLLADPGTISLVKSGSTVLTATVLTFFGRNTNKLQWIAIFFQLLGIVASQYNPCVGSTSAPIQTYLLLFVAVCITAFAGCCNDHITKSFRFSLHGINVVLYAFGFLFNLSVFLVQKLHNPLTPGFFEGYTPIAVLVVGCNSLIGLAITAVYKYADAVVKTLAQVFSTGLLIIISNIFFGSKMSFTAAAGVLTVFLATYLYFISSTGPIAQILAESSEETKAHHTVRRFAMQLLVVIGLAIFFWDWAYTGII